MCRLPTPRLLTPRLLTPHLATPLLPVANFQPGHRALIFHGRWVLMRNVCPRGVAGACHSAGMRTREHPVGALLAWASGTERDKLARAGPKLRRIARPAVMIAQNHPTPGPVIMLDNPAAPATRLPICAKNCSPGRQPCRRSSRPATASWPRPRTRPPSAQPADPARRGARQCHDRLPPPRGRLRRPGRGRRADRLPGPVRLLRAGDPGPRLRRCTASRRSLWSSRPTGAT